MKKIVALSIALLFIMFKGISQDTPDTVKYWKYSGVSSLTLSQVSFTNWAAGGENSFSALATFNENIVYKKDNLSWDNTVDLAYGLINQNNQGNRKSDDKVDIASKFGIKASEKLNYTILGGFKTQMFDGFKYDIDDAGTDKKISGAFAPAYITLSLGIDYIPNEYFTVFASPLSGKITVVNDTALSVNYGLEKGENSRSEIGGMVKAEFKKDVVENVNLQTKVELFSNYVNNPQNIDVNWQLALNLKVNDFISANIGTQLVYDDDIKTLVDGGSKGPKIQFKEVFGLGFNVEF